METRKLHIDLDGQATTSVPADESSQEARRLQDSIARIVKDGSSESHLRALIEECGAFLKTHRAQVRSVSSLFTHMLIAEDALS
jgi:hypothetical protein